MRKLGLILAALCLVGSLAESAEAAEDRAPVAVVRLEGAIDVPSAEYLARALRVAEEQDAQCLVVRLNTLGGLGEPMNDMTTALLNARIPTVVYVYPAGGFAISAGTFVTLSAHIAAMHPATTIGAAHPVQLFSMPEIPEGAPEQTEGEEGADGGKAAEPPQDVMMKKMVNTFALQARVIAEERGRNAEWAEQAVRESRTSTAREAFGLGVVDLLANDPEDLLRQLDGREVALPGGRSAVLQTDGAPVVEIPASPKERFLHVLANPNILLVLLVLAGLGIMFELQNPGAILPGVVGGLSLLLALYSMNVLPVNYAGVGLIVFAMLLFFAEVKVVSHGVLTVGGVASFVVGALMLMDTTLSPALRVSWQVVIVMAVLILLFFLFVVGAAIRAHRRPVATGTEGMKGERGRTLGALSPNGEVLIEGERWRARAVEGEIEQGVEIEVLRQEGFTLLVRPRGPAEAD